MLIIQPDTFLLILTNQPNCSVAFTCMKKKQTDRRHSISIMYDIIYVVKYLVGLMFVNLNTSTYTEVRYSRTLQLSGI